MDRGPFRDQRQGARRQASFWRDGKSIFEYDFQRKRVVEHKLPPEYQGKAVAEGPVPFLFGARAEALNRRYWMKIVPSQSPRDEILLDVYPKSTADAQNFKHVELILTDMKHMLSCNPLYVNAASNLRLTSNSPSRSARRTAASRPSR